MCSRLFLISAAAALFTMIPVQVKAQPGIIAIHPSGNPEGEMLDMRETVFQRRCRPDMPARKGNGGSTRAWSEGGTLFLHEGDDTLRIAGPEGPGIVFGETVSRNEFGIDGGIFWSPDSTKIAFYRKDESRVTLFPLLDIGSRTGTLRQIRYPMAGMDSEIISLGIYDIATGSTVYADVSDFTPERYLTGVSWSPDGRRIYVQVLPRSQKKLRLNVYDSGSGAFVRTLFEDSDPRFVETKDKLRFIKGRDDLFVYTTDSRDGFTNLYLCDTLGRSVRLTAVDADVEYVADDGSSVYYLSSEISPAERHFFRVALKKSKKTTVPGKVTRLTVAEGWHEIEMDPDLKGFTDRYSSLNVPGVIEHCSADGSTRERIHTAPDPTIPFAFTEVDFGSIPSADGKYANFYRLIKPLGFDPEKKYPVIVYVYGGPHSQMVRNSWLGQIRMWEMYMAQRGYLVYVQDNRGTTGHGAGYEKAIHGRCGQAEAADQMVGVEMLRSLPYVDSSRIGIHGWSYGGFMTITLMTEHPDVFKAGVAGGPVIDWKWYEVMYGERYMETPESNPEGYAATSLIGKAGNLKGRLLICQGAVDNTVVWEHSLSFVQECIRLGVQVDYFPYPCAEHNMRGMERVHLMDKVTAYFEEHL